ncbi:hypothetical protein BC830DRAFT_778388 [Chytriomyces sp. MP71]|nr:hypothetical protein BC830DRAFT_778388 [Chytriomyces sp. MP71]
MSTIPTVLIQESTTLDMNRILDNSSLKEGKFRTVETSAVTLTSPSRAVSSPNIINTSASSSASSNSIGSLGGTGSITSDESVASPFHVKRSEARGCSDIFAGSTPEIHRTGWDLFGRVEDGVDEPTRRLAGLKLKYRYPVPHNVRNGSTYSGVVMTRQWSSEAPLQKWKKRFMIVKENKAYLLKSEGVRALF